MKNLKRISVLALALIFTIALGFATPQAAKAASDGDWVYTLSGDQAIITGYTGNSASVTIPSTVGGYAVAAIGNQAFFQHTKLVNVAIPSGVTSIGSYAFAGCKKLEGVTIPASVTSIGSGAFAGCNKLKSVAFGGTPERWMALMVVLPFGVTVTFGQYSIIGWEQAAGEPATAADTVGINGQPLGKNGTVAINVGSTVSLDITLDSGLAVKNGKAYLSNGAEVALTKSVNVWSGTFTMPAKNIKICFATTGHAHILTKVDAVAAGCTTPGNIEYYTCSKCNDLFADAAGTTVVDDVLIPATGHKMTHHEDVAPSCTVTGVVEHWECEYCGNLYSDEFGNTAVTAADVTIPIDPNAHDWGEWSEKTAPTVDTDGVAERICNLNAAHTEEKPIPKLDLMIIEGANQTYTKGSGADIVIKTNGTAEFFADLTMDGSSVGVDHYVVAPGSTVITLKAAYLDTLEERTYEVGFVYLDDRMVKTNLTIAPAGNGNGNGSGKPQTGDESPLIALGALLALSGVGMLVILRRKIRAGR